MCPQIPVGGRLQYFYHQWEKITDDKWVLQTLKEGLKLEFLNSPFQTGVRKTNVSSLILEEVKKLLEKCAKELVPYMEIQNSFTVHFSNDKKLGDLRPMIKLRPLNRYIVKKHFKMDTLIQVIDLVNINDWAISLKLKDAYLYIPMHPNNRKYLRFHVQGKVYQFKAMCFGPTQAQRIFTNIIATVAAYL